MTERFDQEFVEFIPPVLEDGKLYISIEYATAVHKCASGCGQKVVTPLSPTDWNLTFDGVAVSLSPSIGNWNFECQSHYWIKNNEVVWGAKWTKEQIQEGRRRDALAKQHYYRTRDDSVPPSKKLDREAGRLSKLKDFIAGLFGRRQ